MSSLPTPISRLPAPKGVSRPVGGVARPALEAKKRTRGSVDLEQAQDHIAKKTRIGSTSSQSSTLSKAKSMMSINKGVSSGGSSRATRPLPSSMTTGRPTSITARSNPATGRKPLGVSNGQRANQSVTDAGKSKKRAPWDLKGRLEDMEALTSRTTERIATLESQNFQLKNNVQEKEMVVVQNSEELGNLKKENETLLEKAEKLNKEIDSIKEESDEKLKKFKREIDDLEFNKSSLERKMKALEDELTSKQEEVCGLKTTVSQLSSSAAGIEAELKTSKKLLADSQGKVADLTKLSSEQAAKIEMYEEKERAFETERRRLHNTIQELKGNIRVFCRIRPLLGEEIASNDGQIKHIDIVDEKALSLVRAVDSPNESVAAGLKGKSGRYDFEFDRVFDPQSTQAQVFEEISQLVQSAIDGYNVCVFAYGQTGSGKTFTMEGGEDQEQQSGMIPRTIEKIFQETNRLKEKGWTYKMEANFLEIYNEEIRDLLATEKNLKYDIKMAANNSKDVFVTNIKIEEVSTGAQIANLLKRARKNRAVAATNCNERSSRSHSVFQLKISGNNSITTEACTGMLNLVDLAGSERLKDSGSEGARLTETKNINRSLANLGNVIMALAQKDSHVPYRNSKLTHLLQPSLGGNSKTLMFVNVSPREEYFGETLNSLRFATKVNQCQIGTATKKIK